MKGLLSVRPQISICQWRGDSLLTTVCLSTASFIFLLHSQNQRNHRMTEMLAKEDILLELRPSVALFSCEAFKDAGSIACPGNLSQCCTTLLINFFFFPLIMYSLNPLHNLLLLPLVIPSTSLGIVWLSSCLSSSCKLQLDSFPPSPPPAASASFSRLNAVGATLISNLHVLKHPMQEPVSLHR